MALQEIAHGSEASSTVLNNNFNHLQNEIVDTNQSISEIEEELTARIGVVENSITSQIETFQVQLNQQIAEVNESLTNVIAITESLTKTIIPNYNNGIDISSGYRTQTIGWVNWTTSGEGNGQTRCLYVNGVAVGYQSYYKYGHTLKFQILVDSGDVITFSSNTSAKFYPCKGDV